MSNKNTQIDIEQLIEQQNVGWIRLFPDNPELEEPFMMQRDKI